MPFLKKFLLNVLIVQMEQNSFYECAFWDQTLNDSFGGWSSKGCTSSSLHPTYMHCTCNHLSRYAVIMEFRSSFMKYQIRLSYIALYTARSTSTLGLLVIILTFILFRQYRKNLKHKVLFNLALSMFLKSVTGWADLKQIGDDVIGCYLVALLHHYLMLSSFAWMLVEAFIQYHCLVKIIGTYIPRFMQKACLFGWGVPLIFVGITLTFDHQIYISKNRFCRARVRLKDRVLYYGVAGPAVIMTAMTFVIFVLILRSTCRNTKMSLRTHQNKKKMRRARAQAIFCVSTLLGIAWVHGMINVYGNFYAIQYLYATMLTLQAIFIFTYFVFVNKETRTLWFGLFRTLTKTPHTISHIDISTSAERTAGPGASKTTSSGIKPHNLVTSM